MDQFIAWNLRLLEAFFSPASKGEEVWLAVDPEELDAIAPDLGGDQGLLEAVRSGPGWPTISFGGVYTSRGTPADFTKRSEGLRIQRRKAELRPKGYSDPGLLAKEYAGRDAPCYLPLLAALIRCAASQDEDGYYVELRKALLLPPYFHSPDMASLQALWLDLAEWSNVDYAPFGRFVVRQLGGYKYVGVPRSQSIISRRDSDALTRVFAQCGLRPGQRASERLLGEVHSRAAGAHFLSAPFLAALNHSSFDVPIRERLRSLFEDWDGTLKGLSRRESGVIDLPHVPRPTDAGEDVELALALGHENTPPWQVRWRIPAIRDAGSATLREGGTEWSVTFAGTERAIAQERSSSLAIAFQSSALLARSENQAIRFAVHFDEETSSPDSPSNYTVLPASILRSLVAERVSGSTNGQVMLVERPLPSNGGAYLLGASSNASRLKHFLTVHPIASRMCTVEGLPDGWLLAFLPDCSQLTEEILKVLPTGIKERAQARAVRLVGGRAIQRAGIRQYLAYDLPSIELDAPAGTSLGAAGLSLRERRQEVGPGIAGAGSGLIGEVSSLRHFEIGLTAGEARSFLIRATCGREEVGEVRLRIAPGSGLQTHGSGHFKLDPLGHPASGEEGLLGVLCRPSVAQDGDGSEFSGDLLPEFPIWHLGKLIGENDAAQYIDLAAAQFLDTLGQQRGSLEYGVARDQIRRLIDASGGSAECTPVTILMDLRSRGFLEIETDSKGRMVRVHAVSPALCLLPHIRVGGSCVAFPVGTLRHQHWREFCSARAYNVSARWEAGDESTILPTLRFVAPSPGEMKAFAHAHGLPLVPDAARSVAAWAASLDDVSSQLATTGVESLGSGDRPVERYVPASGLFAISGGTALYKSPKRQLFRIEDAETGSHRTYSLGFWDEQGRERYSFVRDSRWGVWLALASFSEFVRDEHHISDASPWPLHHDRDGTLWLPARINLPVVLERALVFCAGGRPIQVRVSGEPSGETHRLTELGSRDPLGDVSRVYTDFAPQHPRWGTWLGYQLVPDDVARIVAGKLGGSIQPLGKP